MTSSLEGPERHPDPTLCPNHLVSSTLELKKPERPAAHRVLNIVPAMMGSSRMTMQRFTNLSRESKCHLNGPGPNRPTNHQDPNHLGAVTGS
ncbi:hypothetical protein PGT21_025007 [Puccinia graminis f. sp. tritici]|uniref:Uncharacterized protein n=1 Tax=Puccinia graminis f. sp. tritici TaxID=56615 RepID=A0A5B0N1L8_PUCGR|nr:hypothetical protein PGT21_025007 [Puccinia graminis f. sp. tritici]